MRHPRAIIAIVAGGLVLATIPALNAGALRAPAGGIALAVLLVTFYVAALSAVRPRALGAPSTPWVARLASPASREAERVRARRRTRIAALGVAEVDALVLADDPTVSVHELERLVAQGCPLDAALRIVWPA
jgi:hypothetical protein